MQHPAKIFLLKPCLSPRSDCAKVAPAPCLFPCIPGARSADFSHKIKLSQPLPPINPASLPQEERTGFSLLCISRIIHQLGFMLTTGGGRGSQGESCFGSWCLWGVCMVKCQKYSVFSVCDHGGNAALTAGSSRLLGFQSQVLLEPLYHQIIFAQGFLLLPVCRRQDLMHTGGLKNSLWPNSGLSPFCCPPHHARGVPNPALQSQTRSATAAALTSCCTWLIWGEGTKPPLGALRVLNAEHTQSACSSCLLPGPAITPVWAWGR